MNFNGMHKPALFLFAIIALACTKKMPTTSLELSIISKKTGDTAYFTVETAITAQEQQRGFMHRSHIPDNTGMVFIYTRDEQRSFWMKDTPHPLSIAFIDSFGRIREIYDMHPFSLEVLTSNHAVRYALEAAQGAFGRAGVAVGDTLAPKSLERLKQIAESAVLKK